MQICAQFVTWAWDFLIGRTPYPMQNRPLEIELRVGDKKIGLSSTVATIPSKNMKDTKEASEVDRNKKKDTGPWRLPTPTSMVSSQGNPLTPITSPQYLSPYAFQGRNSLCSANDYHLRRRRPMTLKIGPRLSLPNKSTSAPTSTTDGEWPAHRIYQKKSPTPSVGTTGSRAGWRSRRSITTAGATGHQHHVIASVAATAQAKMQAEQGSIGELRGYHNLRSRRHTLANVR